MGFHTVLSILLTTDNHRSREHDSLEQAPEEVNGVISRIFFTWINPVLLKGYKQLLVQEDVPPLRSDMRPELTREEMLCAWERRGVSFFPDKYIVVCH